MTSFPDFEKKFFPEVLAHQGDSQGVTYCQYDNQALQLFTSSLYLAGIFSTLVGGYTSRCAGIASMQPRMRLKLLCSLLSSLRLEGVP